LGHNRGTLGRAGRFVWMGVLLGAPAADAGEPRADPEVEANAAYQAKQFDRCADLFNQVAAGRKGSAQVSPLYNAACCHARAKRVDLAFDSLDRAIAAGLRDAKQAEGDDDLASLRTDPRWEKLMAKVSAASAAFEKSLQAPALRRELLALVEEDQAAREEGVKSQFKDKAAVARIEASDRKSTARLKEIVSAKGWPGKTMVGEDGAQAAWLLVQHADKDLSFQKQCLAKMAPLTKTGEVSAQSWAFLVDRVAIAEKRKQVYGTQFGQDGEPAPMEDPESVDARRKSVGLGTMADYKAQMRAVYGPPPATP
jgi:hypothetical protein